MLGIMSRLIRKVRGLRIFGGKSVYINDGIWHLPPFLLFFKFLIIFAISQHVTLQNLKPERFNFQYVSDFGLLILSELFISGPMSVKNLFKTFAISSGSVTVILLYVSSVIS